MLKAKKHVQVELREARISDAADIARLTHALGYPSSARQVRERLQAMLRDPRNHIVVAEMPGDGLVGWLHVFRHALLEMEPFAEIGGLIVGEAFRGRGIGARLIEAAQRWTVSCGLGELRVRTRVERERAHRFYYRQGFELRKTQLVLSLPLA